MNFIDDYLRDLPDNYNGMNWKILPNNSASPTLIILTNGGRPLASRGCPKKLQI